MNVNHISTTNSYPIVANTPQHIGEERIDPLLTTRQYTYKAPQEMANHTAALQNGIICKSLRELRRDSA